MGKPEMIWVLLIITVLSMSCLPANCQGIGLVPGQVAHERVAQLTASMPWYKSLGEAEKAAYKQRKMVLWVHMLGDIKGAT
jgi:hypothetical protein